MRKYCNTGVICVGTIRGFTLGTHPPTIVIPHWGEKEKPQPHISTKKQPSGCNAYEELLGGLKSIPSKPLSRRYSSDLTTTKLQSYSKIYQRALFLATAKVLHTYTWRGKTVKIPPTGRTLAAEWWEEVSTYMHTTPSLYLILLCLWLYRHSFSSGWKSHLHLIPAVQLWGAYILNCTCVDDGFHRDEVKSMSKKNSPGTQLCYIWMSHRYIWMSHWYIWTSRQQIWTSCWYIWTSYRHICTSHWKSWICVTNGGPYSEHHINTPGRHIDTCGHRGNTSGCHINTFGHHIWSLGFVSQWCAISNCIYMGVISPYLTWEVSE